jgi:hemerythrin-like domain-containing protein
LLGEFLGARHIPSLLIKATRHSAGEEIVVYPLFEKHLGEQGKKMADEDRAEHLVVKKQLAELDTLITKGETDTVHFDKLVTDCLKHLKEHIEGEESNDLPSLEKVLDREDSIKVAKSFERTKMLVPTR